MADDGNNMADDGNNNTKPEDTDNLDAGAVKEDEAVKEALPKDEKEPEADTAKEAPELERVTSSVAFLRSAGAPKGKVEKDVNLESVLLYHEELPRGHERKLANNLNHAFAPCRIFMIVLLRFPLVLHVRADYTREFSYSWKSFRGWMFFITGSIIILNVTLIAISLTCALLDYPPPPQEYVTLWFEDATREKRIKQTFNQEHLRIQELFLLQRNFVPMVMLLLSLFHVCTGDVSLFFRRGFIAKYFTFWDEAIEIMKMDAGKHPEDVRKFMLGITSFYCCFLLIFLTASAFSFAPLATGAPAELSILWIRWAWAPIHAWPHFHYLRYVGYGVYGYLICTSKAYVLLFLYKCKIMKNAFSIWNERLENVLHKGGPRTRLEQCETRTGYDHLFRDYVVLLDLLRGADTMFTNVIESYYGTQVFSLCFEVYYLVRGITAHAEFKNARKLDMVLIGIYMFHSMIMLFVSSTAAADVGEKAMEGLEIIRRKGFIGRKTNQEMYFTLSLYMSYTGHFETALTAGRFVIFDRGFIVALVATIFSYFIILIQFTPPLALMDEEKLGQIDSKMLVINVEQTRQYWKQTFPIGF